MKITYGASGLIEWVACIPAGKAKRAVHFQGGASTKYGVVPAEFTTSDADLQKAIEGSAYFKQGRIAKLRESDD